MKYCDPRIDFARFDSSDIIITSDHVTKYDAYVTYEEYSSGAGVMSDSNRVNTGYMEE